MRDMFGEDENRAHDIPLHNLRHVIGIDAGDQLLETVFENPHFSPGNPLFEILEIFQTCANIIVMEAVGDRIDPF